MSASRKKRGESQNQTKAENDPVSAASTNDTPPQANRWAFYFFVLWITGFILYISNFDPQPPVDMITAAIVVYGFPVIMYIGHRFGKFKDNRAEKRKKIKSLRKAVNHGFLSVSLYNDLKKHNITSWEQLRDKTLELCDKSAELVESILSEKYLSRIANTINPSELEILEYEYTTHVPQYQKLVDEHSRISEIFNIFKSSRSNWHEIMYFGDAIKLPDDLIQPEFRSTNQLLVRYQNSTWKEIMAMGDNHRQHLNGQFEDIKQALDERTKYFKPWEHLLSSLEKVTVGLKVPFHRLSELVSTTEDHIYSLMNILIKQYPELGEINNEDRYYLKHTEVTSTIDQLLKNLDKGKKLKKV